MIYFGKTNFKTATYDFKIMRARYEKIKKDQRRAELYRKIEEMNKEQIEMF